MGKTLRNYGYGVTRKNHQQITVASLAAHMLSRGYVYEGNGQWRDTLTAPSSNRTWFEQAWLDYTNNAKL